MKKEEIVKAIIKNLRDVNGKSSARMMFKPL